MMFYDDELTLQERRRIANRRILQRRLEVDRRRRAEACVRAFFSPERA